MKIFRRITVILVNLVAVALVALAAFLGWSHYQSTGSAFGQVQVSPTPIPVTPTTDAQAQGQVDLPDLIQNPSPDTNGITRAASMDTNIPTRSRVDVITYNVQQGDSIFSIADQFSLKPETILWGNFDVLEDNPHVLKTGQEINILPTNGIYYQWEEGDSITAVAEEFRVEPEAILEYPGNRFDLTEIDNPDIEPGTWLIIPGGWRPIKDWGPPAITRQNPASAAYYGSGHCGSVYEGALGTGSFIWPTVSRQISGYTYNPPIHPAIDIGGAVGNAIFAADSGVVVYAGWSEYGFGYLVVIDHGNGWQSAYAHLSSVAVSCGQSVARGTTIGGLGSTGRSSGPHLHFELVYNGSKVNPFNFLQ
jgi:murein DD-endopeptidase MepM/ murein hydrolase activator NlpD